MENNLYSYVIFKKKKIKNARVMHFLLKNALFREVHLSRKLHFSFAQFFFCRDRGPKYLSRRICEILDPCPGIAIINEIIHKQIFHA